MFSFPEDLPSDPKPLDVFWRWMDKCDRREWKVSRKLALKLLDFIQTIANTYGLTTDENAAMFQTIEKELKRRARIR